MFQRIWQQLLYLWRRIKQVFIKSPPPPPPPKTPPPSFGECEQKFMELLEGVANGWSRSKIQWFLIATNIKIADWENWLQEFRERLLASPTPNVELASRLVLLGDANCWKVSEISGKIGRELLARENEGREHSGEVIQPKNEPILPIVNINVSNSNPTIFTNTIGDSPVKNQPLLGPDISNIEISQDLQELLNRAETLSWVGDLEGSLACYDKAIEIKSDFYPAWNCRGQVLDKLGRYQEATLNYSTAIALQSNKSEISGKIGRELLARENEGREQSGEVIQPKNEPILPIENINGKSNPTTPTDKSDQPPPEKREISPEAIELFNQGRDSYYAGNFVEAKKAFQKALEIDPNFHLAWHGLGNALEDLGRYDDAIRAFQKALDINPNFHYALYGLGYALYGLGRYDDVIVPFQKALDINPKYVDGWNGLGTTLNDLGRYDDAIVPFQKALEIDPNYHYAWNGLGNALNGLGRYDDAIRAFQKALEIDPNYHYAWNGLGTTLNDLGRYDDAIAPLQKALEIDPNYHHAWNGLGSALNGLGRYSEAIAAYDKALEITHDQFWMAWANRGWAFFDSGRYLEAIQNWDEGLQKYLPSNRDYRVACGQLHKKKGEAHYEYGKQKAVRSQYFYNAKASYLQACEYLTNPLIPEVYLEVLQGLIMVCRSLGDAKTNEYLTTATTLLEQLLLDSKTGPLQKQLLSRKFAGFYQLEVDTLVESGDKVKALQKAEERKNFCIKWMEKGWQTQVDSPTFPQMQELLNGDTTKAIIYWHLSPVTLTAFIIRYQQDINTVITPLYQFSLGSKITLEKLLDNWKTDYQDYRKSESQKRETTPKNHLWRDNMIANLEKLQTLLNIPNICDKYLSHVSELILIPHRDLHLLPLESLFLSHPDRAFLITRLPSAKIGLKLNQENPHPSILSPLPNLLSIEDPHTQQPMLFAEIESAAICQLSAKPHRIWGASATQQKVKNALKIPNDIFHFTGHGYHLTQSPLESALKLADKPLTLGDIFQLNLRQYHLVFLSACETGITGKEGLTDEFVGLVSGFLAVGATYVISTLWAVKDYSTAWLVINFYQRLHQGIAPAEALKQAQNWLRTVTHSKLAQWLGSLALELANFEGGCAESLEDFAEDQKEIAIIRNDNPPYADPYFWAGFTITGKVN